jgi:hypothetical protein
MDPMDEFAGRPWAVTVVFTRKPGLIKKILNTGRRSTAGGKSLEPRNPEPWNLF